MNEVLPRVVLQDRVPATIHHLYGSGEVEGRGPGWTACGIKSESMLLATDCDYDHGRPCKRCPWTPSTSFCARCGRNAPYGELVSVGPGYVCRGSCRGQSS